MLRTNLLTVKFSKVVSMPDSWDLECIIAITDNIFIYLNFFMGPV